jgi:hypothetical protein
MERTYNLEKLPKNRNHVELHYPRHAISLVNYVGFDADEFHSLSCSFLSVYIKSILLRKFIFRAFAGC